MKLRASAITDQRVIENIVLSIEGCRHNLDLSVNSGAHQVTNPGKSGGNHLLSPHCETITLSSANPDGMDIDVRRQPRPTRLVGVFCFLLRKFHRTS